jgi:hypothetical protein
MEERTMRLNPAATTTELREELRQLEAKLASGVIIGAWEWIARVMVLELTLELQRRAQK